MGSECSQHCGLYPCFTQVLAISYTINPLPSNPLYFIPLVPSTPVGLCSSSDDLCSDTTLTEWVEKEGRGWGEEF